MLKPIKNYGQNFLVDVSAVNKMLATLDPKKSDLIIEIGPGLGALTTNLAETGAEIKAIEIDERFIPKLKDKYSRYENFEVINANILNWLPEYHIQRSFKVIGSIPYYITSPIVHEIVKHNGAIDCAVLMVQKEVADKLVSLAPDGSYLSVFVNSFYTVDLVSYVPKESFEPVPEVDSAIIKMTKLENPSIPYELQKKYEGFLHKGFATPRKMLHKVFGKETMEKLEIDSTLRPQHLTIDEWIKLFNYFSS